MDNIILQFALDFTTVMMKKLEKMIEKEFNITALVAEVKEATDRLGINIVKNVLENLDETIKKDEKRKKEWIVERKAKKSIVTMLNIKGPITSLRRQRNIGICLMK